jgi:hypothetical protein
MQQKHWRTPFVISVSAVCGFMMAFLLNCGSGPQITVYVSDPSISGMEFYNEKTGDQGFVPYSQTDKFFCLNQADTQTLLNYCGIKPSY